MTPTPEQLQAWREEAEAIWDSDDCLLNGRSHPMTALIHGYLRAKQETEQAVKDVKRKIDAIEECLFQKHPSSEAKLLALRELLND